MVNSEIFAFFFLQNFTYENKKTRKMEKITLSFTDIGKSCHLGQTVRVSRYSCLD